MRTVLLLLCALALTGCGKNPAPLAPVIRAVKNAPQALNKPATKPKATPAPTRATIISDNGSGYAAASPAPVVVPVAPGPTLPATPAPVGRAPQPAPELPTPAPALPAPPTAHAIAEMAVTTFGTLDGMSGITSSFEQGPDSVERHRAAFAFRPKPFALGVNVLDTEGMSKGARMVWAGGEKFDVKAGPFPGPIAIAIDNPLTKSKNGWTVKDLSAVAVYGVLGDPDAVLTLLDTRTIGADAVDLLKVKSKRSPKGVAYEVIGVAQRDHLAVVRQFFDAAEALRYDLKLETRSSGPVDPATLKL